MATMVRSEERWATQLARRRAQEQVAEHTLSQVRASRAAAALQALFDVACNQANAALGRSGLAERVTICDTPGERRYCLLDPDGTDRYIAVAPVLPAIPARGPGGVYIGASGTRSSIYLDPATDGSEHWTATPSVRPFGASEIHDLFLSVFADDPGATARLSPITGGGFFEDPWN